MKRQVRQNCRATFVIPPGTSVATIVTIFCNHRDGEYFLHRITSKLGSTATSTVITRLLRLTNYILGAENETQRALLGHTNGNNEMRSPSVAAMLTMVTVATIVRFPPVHITPLPTMRVVIQSSVSAKYFTRITPDNNHTAYKHICLQGIGCVCIKNCPSKLMQPSSSSPATIVSAENQNDAPTIKAIFFICHYYIVWESYNAGGARRQS